MRNVFARARLNSLACCRSGRGCITGKRQAYVEPDSKILRLAVMNVSAVGLEGQAAEMQQGR